MERLLRLVDKKYADISPTNGGPHPRAWSPIPGRSTLITSAPRSPSSMAQYGPASASVISTTRIPSRTLFTTGIIAESVFDRLRITTKIADRVFHSGTHD